MNDLVLQGFVKSFAETKGLSHLDPNHLFEAFVASSLFRKYHQAEIADMEDGILVGGSGDGGLDAVGIVVNGRPAHTEEDISFFVDNLRRLDVEFVFVQAKSSAAFNSAAIGSFMFGIEQFFAAVAGSPLRINFNSDILQLIDLTRHIYSQTIKMQQNPKCFAYFVTSGTWTGAADPSGRFADGVETLRKLNLFSDIRADPVDGELLKAIYRELERGVVKDVEFSKTAVFPRIDGVDDAYIGLLPGDEFIKLVCTDDGQLNRELFYDNVRDFQGHNPVNGEINHTLADEQLRDNFPLLNNGVTIVARELTRRGDIFTISDFQIVNGCQTTHIVFQNKSNIGADTFIPVKLVATSDRQVISEVIKATNRQTAVLPEALESLTPFHKELEDFYYSRESSRTPSDRIYYERRSKQYAADQISPRNIVTLTGQIKSFIGMFLNEPHSHPRYYGELLRAYEGRLFAKDHRPAPYYASGTALLTVEKWLNGRPGERDIRSYKHQLLMLLRASIGGKEIPRLNSNGITTYSLQIVEALHDQERSDEECSRAAELLRTSLTKFGSLSGSSHGADRRNPPHRLRAFTEQLIQDLPPARPKRGVPQSQDSAYGHAERGRIIWYDEWKNFGFIERESGGDIFVHQSQIGSIPWHLRVANLRVRYKVVDNPKTPGMLMASEVSVETT